ETNHGYQESCEETRQEGGQEVCPQVRQGEDRHGTQDRTQDGAEGCEESSEEAGTQARCQEDRTQAHREEGRDGQDGARQQDQACEESEEVSKPRSKHVATVSRCLRHHNHKPAFPAMPSAGMRAIRMTLAPVLPGLSVFGWPSRRWPRRAQRPRRRSQVNCLVSTASHPADGPCCNFAQAGAWSREWNDSCMPREPNLSLRIQVGRMITFDSSRNEPASARHFGAMRGLGVAVGMALLLAGCGKGEGPVSSAPVASVKPAASAPASTAPAELPAATPSSASSAAEAQAAAQAKAKLSSMSVTELLSAARDAYAQHRLVAPAGDNAMEYYEAVLAKDPKNQVAKDALRETFPFGVPDVEKAISQNNFAEANRE